MARVSRLAEFKLDPYASFLRFRRRSGRNEWIRTILNEDVFPPRGKEWMDLYGWIRKEWRFHLGSLFLYENFNRFLIRFREEINRV